MPPFPQRAQDSWGMGPGQKMRAPPQIFWGLTQEQVVELLTMQGYSKRAAERDAAEFTAWREKIQGDGPKQQFTVAAGEEDTTPPGTNIHSVMRMWGKLK